MGVELGQSTNIGALTSKIRCEAEELNMNRETV
jgi:hypothetical protein